MSWDSIRNFLTTAGVDLLRGLVALAVGLFLVHWVTKLFERYENKMKLKVAAKREEKKQIAFDKLGVSIIRIKEMRDDVDLFQSDNTIRYKLNSD